MPRLAEAAFRVLRSCETNSSVVGKSGSHGEGGKEEGGENSKKRKMEEDQEEQK